MVFAIFKVSVSFAFSWEMTWGRGLPSREKKEKGISSVIMASSIWEQSKALLLAFWFVSGLWPSSLDSAADVAGLVKR